MHVFGGTREFSTQPVGLNAGLCRWINHNTAVPAVLDTFNLLSSVKQNTEFLLLGCLTGSPGKTCASSNSATFSLTPHQWKRSSWSLFNDSFCCGPATFSRTDLNMSYFTWHKAGGGIFTGAIVLHMYEQIPTSTLYVYATLTEILQVGWNLNQL